MRLPKGAIKPRPAVQQMAPYSPPTGGRAGRLRAAAEGLKAHARSVEVRAE
jgi:hypothetical protein